MQHCCHTTFAPCDFAAREALFCALAWNFLWTYHFSCLLRFGWINVLMMFHIIFHSSFSNIKKLVLLFAPEMVRAICPKSLCFQGCCLPLCGFWRGSVTHIGDLKRVSFIAALGTLLPWAPEDTLLHITYRLQKGIWPNGANAWHVLVGATLGKDAVRHLGIREEKGMKKSWNYLWDCHGAWWKGRQRSGWKFTLQACFAYHIENWSPNLD